MTNEERMREYIKDCEKAKSNLEASLLGRVSVTICKSCKNTVPREMKLNACKVLGEVPREYREAEEFICPHYDRIPNCPDDYLPSYYNK